MAGLRNVVAVGAGSAHGLVLRSDGTVVAWGKNDYGQTNVPFGLSNVVAVSAGPRDNLALRSDGTVVAWGDAWPVPPEVTNVVAISAGAYHELALRADGTVVAWGFNLYGECDVPPGLSNVVAIAAGGFHSMARTVDGKVVTWGLDGYGQTDLPAGLSSAAAISAGVNHSLALIPFVPALSITRTAGGGIHLQWPSKARGWTLQQSDRLEAAKWDNATEPISDDGTNISASADAPLDRTFYRLRHAP